MDFPWIFHGFSLDFQWISYGFSWIFGEAAGAADKKCGGVWGGGGSPPHESLARTNHKITKSSDEFQNFSFLRDFIPQIRRSKRKSRQAEIGTLLMKSASTNEYECGCVALATFFKTELPVFPFSNPRILKPIEKCTVGDLGFPRKRSRIP